MDFFAQQDRARRNLRLLLALFLIAVAVLILLANVLITGFIWFSDNYNLYSGAGARGYLELMSWERFATVGLAVAATVALVSLLRWLKLASGGKTVAESMGGRRILRQSDNADEQRCLNIVEELALAANMPVPALYVLPEERGINAFAAGVTPADAVVAVTRGALLQLNRDELQGVIGHEFSHILNGDMRLSIQLAALLKGITFIGDVGHLLLRAGAHSTSAGGRRNERSAALPVLGLGLLVIGWLGALAAGFIKAAISRQKEYLADASAVQFTRSNLGIAGALKVIGGFIPGSLVHAGRAPEMSHIFFGEIRHHIWNAFSTHPPLPRRIRRLDPAWDGNYIRRAERRYAEGPLSEDAVRIGVGREALVLAAAASAAAADAVADARAGGGAGTAGAAGAAQADNLAALEAVCREPLGAMAVAFALLVVRQGDELDSALQFIDERRVQGLGEQVRALLEPVRRLRPPERFPLVAAAMPALKSLSGPQYQQFKNTLVLLIRADRRTDLFEWCLFQLLRHYLDPEYQRVTASRPRHAHLGKLRRPLRQVLSVLAHQGSGSSASAFAAAADSLGLHGLSLLAAEDCSVADFSEAVHTLADCYPLLKPRVLKAMILAAEDDGEFCAAEREIVIAVAAVMDCPLPDELAL